MGSDASPLNANQSTGILAAMSQDSGAPEDRAQNLGEAQQAATAIMIDRAVSNLETILRVDNDISHNELERRMSTPGLNTRVLPLSSPYVAANGEQGPTTSERRHSSASSLVYPRSKYWNVDDSRRGKFVQPDAPSLDPSRASFVSVSPTPVVADNLGPKYCHPCRGSSPHVAGFVNHRPASPSGVDSARPSLSVFRFKQMPPHATNVASPVPLRTLSPRRRGSAGEVSASLLKPTFNSARRSTIRITAHALAERNGSSSPTQDRLPDRRASVSDAAPSGAKQARRKTSAGDGPGPPARRQESEPRSPRMELSGPLGAVVISWTNMTVTSREGKILLDNLSGQVHTGFTAIIGPSGSGKSTLLNTLACRMDKSANVHGKIRLNGKGYTNADLKRMSGYVMQDDLLNPHLTVDETLWYTVKLKLAPAFTEQELEEKVNTVVKQMGLEHCRGTVIGSALRKGISGGERKRVAVGMELLTGPQLLFLDEPTSGLDSVTALSLCTLLRDIADERYCTVLCTIHQPQSKIFNLFQHLIILKAGKLIYQGSAPGVLKFFEESGFPCPEFTNPADHLLDVISHSNKYHTQSNEEKLRSKFIASPVNLDEGADRPLQLNRERMPWHRQFVVLLNRGYKEQYRKKNVVITQVIQSIITALLIGGVFFQIGRSQKSTSRRQPVLFFCVINQGVFGALTVINSFPSERILILRERAAGMYYSSAYYMAKITAETTCQVISPIIFSFVVYWMVGFQQQARKFFLFVFFMILCQLSATSLALMTSALCRTTDLSVTVLPMLLEINRLFGGFFLPPISLPKYFYWLDALSYVKYCYIAISQNELHDLKIVCLPGELKNGVCPVTSGLQIIHSLGLDYITIADCAGILIVYVIVTRLVAYLGIRFLKD